MKTYYLGPMADLLALGLKIKLLSVYRNKTKKSGHSSVGSEFRADPTGKQKERPYLGGFRVQSRSHGQTKRAAIPRWVQRADPTGKQKEWPHLGGFRVQS